VHLRGGILCQCFASISCDKFHLGCCTGDYRQVHARLRENAEPVAFYGGIAREGVGVLDRFSRLMRHRLRVLRTQLRHSVVQVCSLRH
jgi:ABC-type uncharacterized transport system fused permease/ATPase subunit